MNQAELESLLSSLLARRMANDQPTIINLEGEATMYRPYGRFVPTSYHLSLDALYEPHAPWRPVGRLARILEPLLSDSAIVSGGDGWGEALLPYLGRDRLRVSSTGCMCLGGQETQTAALSRKTHLAVKRGKEPDLLRLVWGIWNVVHVGLTRAHQDNTNSPVAELGSARMPYPIASAELARTRLTARIFPYHRN